MWKMRLILMKLFERSCSELNRVTGLTVTFPAKLHAALDYSNMYSFTRIGDFLQYLCSILIEQKHLRILLLIGNSYYYCTVSQDFTVLLF